MYLNFYSIRAGVLCPLSEVMCPNDRISLLGEVNARNISISTKVDTIQLKSPTSEHQE